MISVVGCICIIGYDDYDEEDGEEWREQTGWEKGGIYAAFIVDQALIMSQLLIAYSPVWLVLGNLSRFCLGKKNLHLDNTHTYIY